MRLTAGLATERLRNTSGTRWALLKRQHIADLLDPTNTYLSRVRILETPWFGVFLHAIRRPDTDRHLHNHPWPFFSIILRGGYREKRKVGINGQRWTEFEAPCVNRCGVTDFHAIESLHRTPTWTLMFVGRRRQDWGYATPWGFVPHETYHAERRAEVGA